MINQPPPPKNNFILLAATVLFVVVGLIALFIGLFTPFGEDSSSAVTKAKLKPERGSTYLKRSGSSFTVTKELSTFVGDIIQTDDIGRAWLDFGPQNGALAILEDTQVELVSLNLGLMVRVVRGSLEVLSAPERSRVIVQYPDSKIKKLADIKPSENLAESIQALEPQKEQEREITQEFLEQAMLRLRPNLLRCYSTYLADKAVRERIDLVANIGYVGGKKGVISVSISSKTKVDPKLEKCVEDTLKGLSLSPYKGPLIDIQLPIILE